MPNRALFISLFFTASLPLTSFAQLPQAPVLPGFEADASVEDERIANIATQVKPLAGIFKDGSLPNFEPIRVSIFPHFGVYTIPQGREPSAKAVNITALGIEDTCKVFPILSPDSAINIVPDRARMLLEARSIPITVKILVQPFWIECASPAIVDRLAIPLDNYVYEGAFLVRKDAAGNIQVINHVNLETYLRGVVPREMHKSWAHEALRAQSIAARSYAVYQIIKNRALRSHPHYDLDDTVQDQVYVGLSGAQPAADLAVFETAGLVLKYKGEVIKAYFSADAGGVTEDAADYFPGFYPYCKSVKELFTWSEVRGLWGSDKWIPALPPNPWTLQFSAANLRTQLIVGKALWGGSPAAIANVVLDPVDRTPTKRYRKIKIVFSNKSSVKIKAEDFRRALKLRSNLFIVSSTKKTPKSPPVFTFTGKGHGHGVGMSQWGANILARKGYKAEQILESYYSDTELLPLGSPPVR